MYGQSVGTLRAYMAPMNMSLKEVIGEDDQEHDYLLFEQMGSKSNDWHEGLVSIKKVDSKFQVSFDLF